TADAAAYKPRRSSLHRIRSGVNGMLETNDQSVANASVEFRDEDGSIRPEFVEKIIDCIERRDAEGVRALAGDLHEADTGALIEALDQEMRPRFVALMGREFDFTALTEVDDTVREEILEELPPTTVAEGVRELDSDDAAYILEDLPKEEQVEVL